MPEAGRAAGPPAEQPVDGGGLGLADPAPVLRRPRAPRPARAPTPAGGRRPCRSARPARPAGPGRRPPAATATRRATVVVLPVPGPPVSTVRRLVAAAAAPSRCRASPAAGRTGASRRPAGGCRRSAGRCAAARPPRCGPSARPASSGRGRAGRRPSAPAGRPGRRPRSRRAGWPRAPSRHPAGSGQGRSRWTSAAPRPRPPRPRRPRPGPGPGRRPGSRTPSRPAPPGRPGRRRAAPARRPRRQLAEPPGDVHVGGGDHRRGVERRQQRTGPQRGARSVRVAAHGVLPSSRSDRSSTSAVGGRHEITPHGRPVDDGGARPAHAAHEQVQRAAQVLVGVVAGQPPAQVPVQRNGVQQQLQRVVRAPSSPRPWRPAGSARWSAARRPGPAGWSCSRRRGSGCAPSSSRTRSTASMLPVR